MIKKIDDEFFADARGGNRTVWYAFEVDANVDALFSQPNQYGGCLVTPYTMDALLQQLHTLIKKDIMAQQTPSPGQTNWIFYTDHCDTDAIKDTVRFTIQVRLVKGHYDCHINVSDFVFVTSFDAVVTIKNGLESLLNS